MRAVTIAATGAAVITTVSASSHVKQMHAKLHGHVARDTWVNWNTTTSVDPATTSTTSSFDWTDWEATKSPTTTKSAHPTTSSSFDWADWEASKSSTTTIPVGASTVDATTTLSQKSTKTVTDYEISGDWSTNAPVDATDTTTGGDWISKELTSTITLASIKTTTKYAEPVSTDSAVWESSSAASSVAAASTWSNAAFSASTADAAADAHSCVVSIITSYGAPVWFPTPVAAVTTSSTSISTWDDGAFPTASTDSWVEWSSSSTNAADGAKTTSTSSSVWSDGASAASASSSASVTVTVSTNGWVGDSGAGGFYSASASSALSSSPSVSSSSGSYGGNSGSNSGTTGYTGGSGSGSSGSNSGSGNGSPGSSNIHANGDSWGLTYSPYTTQGGCKDTGTVAADMAEIARKGFSSVRVYSTDCSTLENIGTSARNNGLKMILGVWISSSGISGAQGQVSDIVNWAQWDLVELIVVGNEAVFNGYVSASALADFISSSAKSFKNAGYTGAVTTTEPLSVWEDSNSASAFCSVVDVVGANLYAFFNSAITADQAGGFIQSQIDILTGVCSGKEVYVLESGWPHAGNCNGAACPSPENQATALQGIHATVGAQVAFLSYEDEPWKEPGQFGVEQFWGCAGVF